MAKGHVRKRGERWYFVHGTDDPATGQRRQKWQGGYASRKDAERGLRESLTSLDTGSWTEPTKLTYAAFVTDVWLPQMRDQVESSTLESYERNLRVHVVPKIGAVRLQKLAAGHLNELYRGLRLEPTDLPKNTNRRHVSDSYARILSLRLRGDSYRCIAEQIESAWVWWRLGGLVSGGSWPCRQLLTDGWAQDGGDTLVEDELCWWCRR
jgi:hypothetical protein